MEFKVKDSRRNVEEKSKAEVEEAITKKTRRTI